MEQPEKQTKRGRPALLTGDRRAVLITIAQQSPGSSLDELTRELSRRCSLKVCSATVRKALKQAGITRTRPTRKSAERAALQDAPDRRDYAKRSRHEADNRGLNTDLTDAEWALVADLFERHGGRGAPPTHERRSVVNACCYVVRTGCPWRLLPESFPPWRAVYKVFRNWARGGVFERMHDRLRQQWRDRIVRAPSLTAAIIEAQSQHGPTVEHRL